MNQHNKSFLEKCNVILARLSEEMLDFSDRDISDPDTGDIIKIPGIDVEKNKEFLDYFNNVLDAFEKLYECFDDIIFFENLFSPDVYPSFEKERVYPQYFKLLYQHWLIKIVTLFDCTLQLANEVFELGVKPKNVSLITVLDNQQICLNTEIFIPLKNLQKVIESTIESLATKNQKVSIKSSRNKIIHQNDFFHQKIDEVNLMSLQFLWDNMLFDSIELERAEYQIKIGNTSVILVEELSKYNFKVATIILELLEKFYSEYWKRRLGKIN